VKLRALKLMCRDGKDSIRIEAPVNLLSDEPAERRRQLRALFEAGLIDLYTFTKMARAVRP